MNQTEARQLIEDCGSFSLKEMSGGYYALKHGDELLAAWVTAEQAVEIAQRLAFPE